MYVHTTTHKISAMRVELTAEVIGGHVDLGLVQERDDLDVRGGAQKLNTGDGTRGDETGTATRLGAPCDFLTFGLTDGGRALGGSPDTPVWAEMSGWNRRHVALAYRR